MDYQPRWNFQADTGFFEDGSTARVPDPNAVAFGRARFDPNEYADRPWAASFLAQRKDLLAEDDAVYLGKNGEDYVDYIPVPVTAERIRRGQERFNIFCAVCHGYEGDGKGMVASNFIAPPADLHADLYTDPIQRTARDGYIFEVIRNGVRNMPGYAHSINVQDAWNIVMYVRALQASRVTSLDELSQADRDALEGMERPEPVEQAPAESPTPLEGDAATSGGGQ